MKRILTILSLFLCLTVNAQKSMIAEDMIDQNGKHVLTSDKEKILMDNGSYYTFRLQAVASEDSTEWYMMLTTKETLPYDNVILLKYEDEEIVTLPAVYMKADTTTVFRSTTYSFRFTGMAFSEGEEEISKIRTSTVHSLTEEQLDKIASKRITKIRVGDALGYATKEFSKKNNFGMFLNKCRNEMLKSILDIREKRKTIYDGF